MAVNLTNVDMNYEYVFIQNDIWNYTYTGSNAEDIKDKGKLYYDSFTGEWYRDFILESKDTKTKIPIAMDVTVNTDGSYTFKPKAIVRQRTIDEMIDKNARANGLEYDKRGINAIKTMLLNYIENESDLVPRKVTNAYKGIKEYPESPIVSQDILEKCSTDNSVFLDFIYDTLGELTDITLPEYITIDQILNTDPDIMDWLWELDHVVFGEDISHKYIEEQITRPTGENVLTPYAKENLQNCVAALVQDNKMTASGLSPDFMYNFVNEYILNSNDADVLSMLSHNQFRIMTRNIGGGHMEIDFVGFDILDNIGTVGTNSSGQVIGVTITSGNYVAFYVRPSAVDKTEHGSVPINISATLKNYPFGDSVSYNGFTSGAGSAYNWSINDTIGVSADRKSRRK